jgi:hypothetical protein
MLTAVQLMSAVHCASVIVATVVVESSGHAVGIATAVCVGASLCGYRRIGPLACAAGWLATVMWCWLAARPHLCDAVG